MLLLEREIDEESVLTAAGTGGFFRAAAGCVVRRGASGRGNTVLLSMVSTDFGVLPSLVASSTCSIEGDVGGWIATVCSRIPRMHRPECLEQRTCDTVHFPSAPKNMSTSRALVAASTGRLSPLLRLCKRAAVFAYV